MQLSQDDGVEDRDKIHKQDPGIGSLVVQMLEDEVLVYCMFYRHVGSVLCDRGSRSGSGAQMTLLPRGQETGL